MILITGANNSSVTSSTTECVHLPRCRGTEQYLTECGSGDGTTDFSSSTTVATVECGKFKFLNIRYYTVVTSFKHTRMFEWGCTLEAT